MRVMQGLAAALGENRKCYECGCSMDIVDNGEDQVYQCLFCGNEALLPFKVVSTDDGYTHTHEEDSNGCQIQVP